MSRTPPLLIMDTRQPRWMGPHLQDAGFQVQVRQLAAGDFTWTCPLGRVGVEDKPLSALFSDRRNGRLDDELRRLCDAYALPILLVRGLPVVRPGGALWFPGRTEHHADWDFNGYDNLRFGRQLRGVLVADCPANEALGWRLHSIYEYTQKAPDTSAPPRKAHFPWIGPLTGKAEVVYVLLGLVRGLRDRRRVAERLAAAVPLDEMLSWGEPQLREAGFSKHMAEQLALVFADMRSCPL